MKTEAEIRERMGDLLYIALYYHDWFEKFDLKIKEELQLNQNIELEPIPVLLQAEMVVNMPELERKYNLMPPENRTQAIKLCDERLGALSALEWVLEAR